MKLIYQHFKIKSRNLCLKTLPSTWDNRLFYYSLKHDKEGFELFSGAPYTKNSARYFKKYFNFPYCFAVYYRGIFLIGYVGITEIKNDNEAVIEFYIRKNYREKHYGYEACGALIQYMINAFENLEKVHAVCLKDNIPAQGLLRKLGFEYVGEQRNVLVVDGQIYNPLCVQYTLEL